MITGLMDKRPRENARAAAFKVLNRIESGDAFADILLEAELHGFSEADAGLATEITNGVLRWRIRLDFCVDLFSSIKTKKLEHRVLNALRIGAYQLLFLTRVPASAAINESVNLVKKDGRRTVGFVNAVLRKIDSQRAGIMMPDESDPVRHISIAYSHPEWIVRRWIGRYGAEEAAALCKANLSVPPRTLRVNTLVTAREKLLAELAAEGIEVKAAAFSPDGIEVVSGGPLKPKDKRYYIQDEASQLVSLLLSPLPGQKVIDACAAPGGKTTHMAQLMGNRGDITAIDRYAGRLKIVNETAARLGVSIIRTMEADSSGPLGLVPASFDAVLCDVPCSGLGVLRRSPDIKYRRKEEGLPALSENQARILENMSAYLKAGGSMVYSTCTFEPEETDEVVRGFLSRRDDFELERAEAFLPEGAEGLADGNGFLRTFPHRHGMDGFFAARLKKVR